MDFLYVVFFRIHHQALYVCTFVVINHKMHHCFSAVINICMQIKGEDGELLAIG